MMANLDRSITLPKEHTRNIWNSYVDWGFVTRRLTGRFASLV